MRTRLYELRRNRAAAERSADLLERKWEVLLREVTRRSHHRDVVRRRLDVKYRRAHDLLHQTRIELGTNAVYAAALAQPDAGSAEERTVAVMGVRLVALTQRAQEWHPVYGAATTAESLDRAGAAFAALVPDLVSLLEEESALFRLRNAARRTLKLLNALRKVVVPSIVAGIRQASEGIEEEERDEGLRRMRLAATLDS